ncbi:hypothetical protein LguiB_005734 [Lonicera macranthoides]
MKTQEDKQKTCYEEGEGSSNVQCSGGGEKIKNRRMETVEVLRRGEKKHNNTNLGAVCDSWGRTRI